MVCKDHGASVGHDTHAISITIKGKPYISIGFFDLGDQVHEVFRLAGVRVMVGEIAIHFAKEGGHITTQGFNQLGGDDPGHAVAAVHNDLQALGQLDIAGNHFGVEG